MLTGNEAEAQRSRNEILRSGMPFEFFSVTEGATFIRRLQRLRPDIIVADLEAPMYTGLSALRDTRRLAPETPIILLATKEDERIAAEALQAGASDYVLKERLRGLGSRVYTTVRRAKKKPGLDAASGAFDQQHEAAHLSDSDAMYRELVEYSNSAIIRWLPDRCVAYVNAFAEAFFGYPRSKLMGMDLAALFASPDEASEKLDYMLGDLLVHPERYINMQQKHRRATGEDVYVAWTNRPILDQKGHLSEVLSIGNDITQLVKTEKQLRRERDRAQQYLDISGTIIVVLDRRGRVKLINRKGCMVLGYAEPEILGADWFERFIPDDVRNALRDAFDQMVAGHIVPLQNHENPVIVRNGGHRRIAWHNALITDERGTISAVLSSGEDITERAAAERALRESETRYRSIFENTGTAMAILDASGAIRLANEELSLLSGYSREELMRKRWNELVDSRQALQLVRHYRRGAADGKWRNFELVMHDRRCEAHCVLAHAGSLGGAAGYIVSLVDISGRRRAEESLRHSEQRLERAVKQLQVNNEALDAANAKLREIDMMKTEFVSMASHELRTPLTGIIGFAETLLSEDIDLDSAQRRRYLRIIESEGKRLGKLLSELLDISKIEKGESVLSLGTLDLEPFIKRMVDALDPPARIRMRVVSHREHGPLKVYGDVDRLEQVVRSIVDNSIRHIEGAGEIVISLQDRGNHALVAISDTGPGIRPEDIERVFEKFYRSKYRSARDERRSSGLGLAIARQIIEAHGGTIWAESPPGAGATIAFTLRKRIAPYE